MQLKTLFLLANAMAFVAAAPAPVPAVADDSACYYKRFLSTWVKRTPGGAEIACGGSEIHQTFHNDEKRATVEAENQACYYKRSTSGVMEYVKRVAGGAEIACDGGGVHIDRVEKREPAMEGVVAAADAQCYYRRHKDGKTVGYKRGPDRLEFLCGGHNEEKRGGDLRADNACYYKRDESGTIVGYKRAPGGAEILCGAAE